ncbi:sporulation protein YqfD [Bacillus sp. B1-b2]|uniref:sporulation protein YqfD n=1 Tax=Bacillus sp. B1-b2 TaxID=2653201 RepID=UPI00126261F0|nr:sporulation protein YqfD [Bacillus sp. B1-b2]KAB7670075.1 sporulation protein YqfD [Bacillus sp. B1-b2]
MKNHWMEYLTGVITVKATGKGLERFLNKLMKNDISVFNIKKHGVQTITFQINLKNIHLLRRVVRGSGLKIEFQRRAGAPFLYKRIWKNSGFVIGLFLFLGLVLTFSNMVWGIEIKGANPATEYQIRKELDKMNIKIGEFQFFSKELDAIQAELTNNIDAITWIGVELKGTTYHFQVVEKDEPEKKEEEVPQNIVAAKRATIVDDFIEEGSKQYKMNQVVNKGQLLVSGMIGKEDNTKTVSAKGKVWGETWYNSEVVIPLETNFQVFNGNEKQKQYVSIGKWEIPVWGFGKVAFKDFEQEENTKPIRFFKWELPINTVNKTYREKEIVVRGYTEEEAIEKGKEDARKDILKQIGEDGKIKEEKILQREIKNGKVKLKLAYTTIENIAKTQPLTQGDIE